MMDPDYPQEQQGNGGPKDMGYWFFFFVLLIAVALWLFFQEMGEGR